MQSIDIEDIIKNLREAFYRAAGTVPSPPAQSVDIETIKEAFYRTFSGQGQAFFSYFMEDEAARRMDVDPYWDEFLAHVAGIQSGKAYVPPDTCHVVPVGPSNYRRCENRMSDDSSIRTLLMAVRQALIIMLGAIEDYLEMGRSITPKRKR